MLAQSLGADVKAFLAGLGIGGLAFALAAQDTIANMFGSFVVVMDHPFRVGDVVKIGAHEGLAGDEQDRAGGQAASPGAAVWAFGPPVGRG